MTPTDVDAELDALGAAPLDAPPPLPAALEAELGDLRPVRPRAPARQLRLLLGGALAYGAVLIAVLSIRRDAHELPLAWMIGAGVAWLVGFVAPCYVAIVPRAGAVMPRWRAAAIAAAVTAVAFVALGLAVHPSGPSSAAYGSAQFFRGHTCLEIGLAAAVVPVVLGTLFLRGAIPVGSRWIAAALGAGSGSLGGLVLHLYCHVADGLHVGLIHGGVVVVAALLAAALVPRAADVR